jgi:hypothetical protein
MTGIEAQQLPLSEYLQKDIDLLTTVSQGIQDDFYDYKIVIAHDPDRVWGGSHGLFGDGDDEPTVDGTGIYERGFKKGLGPLLVIHGEHTTSVEAAVMLRVMFREKLVDQPVDIVNHPAVVEAIGKICRRASIEVPQTEEFPQLQDRYKKLSARIQGLQENVKTIKVWDSSQEVTYAQSLNMNDDMVAKLEKALKNAEILLEWFKNDFSSENEKEEILFEAERLLTEATSILDGAEAQGLEREIDAERLTTEFQTLETAFRPVLAEDSPLTSSQREYLETQFFRAGKYLQGTYPSIGEKDDLLKGVPDVTKAKIVISNVKALLPLLDESKKNPWYSNYSSSGIAKKFGIKEGSGVRINNSKIFPLLPGAKPIVAMEFQEFGGDEMKVTSYQGIQPIGDQPLVAFTRNGKCILAVAENEDWLIAWVYSHDGRIEQYCAANSKGIGTLNAREDFTAQNWEGMEGTGITFQELKKAHNLPSSKRTPVANPKELGKGQKVPAPKLGTFADLMKLKPRR